MKLESITGLEQVEELKEGDVLPIIDHWDYINGNMWGMVEEKGGDNITLIGKHATSGVYIRFQITDLKKNLGIYGERLSFVADPVANKSIKEEVVEDETIIGKYEGAIK